MEKKCILEPIELAMETAFSGKMALSGTMKIGMLESQIMLMELKVASPWGPRGAENGMI